MKAEAWAMLVPVIIVAIYFAWTVRKIYKKK
jgi:hypothetical protein